MWRESTFKYYTIKIEAVFFYMASLTLPLMLLRLPKFAEPILPKLGAIVTRQCNPTLGDLSTQLIF